MIKTLLFWWLEEQESKALFIFSDQKPSKNITDSLYLAATE